MSEEVLDNIKQQITENPIILYMKGSPQAPQCGFLRKRSNAWWPVVSALPM